ncbi:MULTISPECIES: hypothetical protein [Vibrio]|uniref:hypothetical protein n=1 Tax=Vibrio TaxID=662 RepID=UPI0020757D97|nr:MULTISPECIES: hypothetical protein [Vibrio]USD35630.1 hypothetical protein J8Z27_22745 [Vibrio sp. SCSIO 43186]USD72754.1 hypothetical protein J4N41_22750 [Vibrio sp. SCSIO 43139]USD98959.1 hypothetical protein CTT30_23075 [Vibrio coralliilyticus]
MDTQTHVIGAKVSCKTRHVNDRHIRTVTFERTQLNCEYSGQAVACGKVREELNKLGFKSTWSLIKWIKEA